MAPSAEEMNQAKQQGNKHEEVEGEENEWKFRAPYKVHEKDSDFKAIYEGSCHCGKVRYELGREKPLDAKFCHCTTCQVIHGAPFQWAAIFKKEDINFTHGHHDLAWYDSGEKTNRHKLPCKVSCAHCHSWIMDEGRNMILLFPSLIKFGGGKDYVEGKSEEGREERRKKAKEERDMFTPSCHMFYGQRCVDVNDDLPKWEGMSKDSKLVDEGRGDYKVDKKKVEEEIKEKKEKKEEEEKKHKREEEEKDDSKQGKKPKMDEKKKYDLR